MGHRQAVPAEEGRESLLQLAVLAAGGLFGDAAEREADRVDAAAAGIALDQVREAPDCQAMLDSLLLFANLEQLSARHHPILVPRQLRDRTIQDSSLPVPCARPQMTRHIRVFCGLAGAMSV
jgi:hypothetical protein